jgi:GxxExxY protein
VPRIKPTEVLRSTEPQVSRLHIVEDADARSVVVRGVERISEFNDTHYAQMLGYLSITGLKLALLLNFKHARLGWKRIVR